MCTVLGLSSQRFYLYTTSLLSEYKCIYHWGPIILTLKYISEIWFEKKNISACVMKILHESRYEFAIKCRLNDLYFKLFQEIFLLFHIHIDTTPPKKNKGLIDLQSIHKKNIKERRKEVRTNLTNPEAPIDQSGKILINIKGNYEKPGSAFKLPWAKLDRDPSTSRIKSTKRIN